MNKTSRCLRALATAACLLPGLVLAAAGHTAYSSYMQQVPVPPLTAGEAYDRVRKVEVNQGGDIEVRDIQPPQVLELLQQKLADEGALAAGANMPTAPGMGAVTDEASAARLQAQIESMTPAQQMALATQMSQQMNTSMMSGTIGAADQATLELLSRRQGETGQRNDTDLKLHREWAELQRRWQAEHQQLSNAEQAEAAKGSPTGCAGRASNARLRERRWAEQHVALATRQLTPGRAAFEQRRVFAVQQVGFADQLATRVKPNSHALVRQGHAEVRGAAVQQVAALAEISGKLHVHGAEWYAAKRRLEPDDNCGVGYGG